jgi:uncharacterized protein YegJ (DUF2314 family)
MNIRQTIFLMIAACILISCSGQNTKSSDPVVYAKAKDPELEKAKQDALSKLDYFINSFNAHSNDTTYQYSLKVDFVDNGEHEHMWIFLNKIINEQFQGLLENEPQIVKNIKFGDIVRVTKDQIEDWIIMDSKTNNWEGGYSVKVLQKRQQ